MRVGYVRCSAIEQNKARQVEFVSLKEKIDTTTPQGGMLTVEGGRDHRHHRHAGGRAEAQ